MIKLLSWVSEIVANFVVADILLCDVLRLYVVFEGLANGWGREKKGTPIYGEPSKYIKYCEHDIKAYEGTVDKWYALNLEDLEEVLYD